MAEALAGLSIAANVMQVIAFSKDTIATCRSLYTDKSPAPGIALNTKALSNVVGDLNTSLNSSTQNAPQNKDLKALAQELLRIADTLQIEVKKHEVPQGASKIRVFGKALKFNLAGKRKVDELDSTLSKLQNTMQTHILVRMGKELRDSDFVTMAKLDGIDQTLQDFLRQLKSGHTDIELLVKQGFKTTEDKINHESLAIQSGVTGEGVKVREHVSSEIEPVKRHLEDSRAEDLDKMKRDRLLASLYFDDMNTRSNQVVEAHEETFGWILGLTDDAQSSSAKSENLSNGGYTTSDQDEGNSGEDRQSSTGSTATYNDKEAESFEYSSFVEWLKNDAPIFWISGKPGSGKSTLMRFLLSNDRTVDILQKCKPGTQIVAAFIWSAGSPLQRSIKGLLCTILHSLISKAPSVLEVEATDDHIWNKKTHGDWSTKELERTFCALLSYRNLPICLFIDGLDEIDSGLSDGQPRLLELISRLQTLEGIKICLSSRPEPELQHALSRYPSLRLQDLTRNDISKYMSSQLNITIVNDWIRDQRENAAEQDLQRWEKPSLKNLSKAVTYRADGIFLWVALVTKAILKDIIQYDDWNTVLERVDSLPSDMNELYETLWNRQQDLSGKHREFAAVCLKHIVDGKGAASLLGLLFLTAPDLSRSIVGGGSYVSSATLIRRCRVLRHQVEARCCGLLELYDGIGDHVRLDTFTGAESEMHECVHAVSRYKFRFIHRSAWDFLQDTPKGKEILRYDRRAPLQRQCDIILSKTSMIIVLRIAAKNDYVTRLTEEIVKVFQTNHLALSRLSALGLDLVTSALRRDEALVYLPCPLLPAHSQKEWGEYSLRARKYLWLQYISTMSPDVADIGLLFFEATIPFVRYNGFIDSEERLDFIELLLQNGADPNTFYPYIHGREPYHAPFMVGYWNFFMSKRGRAYLQKVLRHRLDTSVRFLARVSHVMGLNFQGLVTSTKHTPRAYPKELLESRFITVLADVGYAHFARSVEVGASVIELLCTEFGDRVKELFDEELVAPMTLVVLIEGTVKRVGRDDTVVTNLSAKLLSSVPRLDQVWSSTHDASSSSPEDEISMIRKEQARLCEFYDQYKSRVLDLDELVSWLVDHKYMAPDGLEAEDKLGLLVEGQLLRLEPKKDLIDRSEVDHTERPEYTLFMEEVQRCIAEGLRDVV